MYKSPVFKRVTSIMSALGDEWTLDDPYNEPYRLIFPIRNGIHTGRLIFVDGILAAIRIDCYRVKAYRRPAARIAADIKAVA